MSTAVVPGLASSMYSPPVPVGWYWISLMTTLAVLDWDAGTGLPEPVLLLMALRLSARPSRNALRAEEGEYPPHLALSRFQSGVVRDEMASHWASYLPVVRNWSDRVRSLRKNISRISGYLSMAWVNLLLVSGVRKRPLPSLAGVGKIQFRSQCHISQRPVPSVSLAMNQLYQPLSWWRMIELIAM